MKLILSILLAGFMINTALAGEFPCATFVNKGSSELTIQNDPNWDDQIVVVDGKKKHSFKRVLKTDEQTVICGTYSEYGIEFYQNGNFARADVSNLNSNLTNLQEIYPDNGLAFHLTGQTQQEMTVNIVSIQPNRR